MTGATKAPKLPVAAATSAGSDRFEPDEIAPDGFEPDATLPSDDVPLPTRTVEKSRGVLGGVFGGILGSD